MTNKDLEKFNKKMAKFLKGRGEDYGMYVMIVKNGKSSDIVVGIKEGEEIEKFKRILPIVKENVENSTKSV